MSTALDIEELLQLAWAASDKGQPDQAITLLKRAIEAAPTDARCHYMLGAEYAQIGMFDRAGEQMASAIALDPGLHAARFQLGLLQLSSRQLELAQQTWAGLDVLGTDHPFVLFKSGLLHLACDEFSECLACLRRGIERNDFNAPLNVDMQRVIDETEPLASSSASAAAVAEPADGHGHLFINAYTQRLN
jgi:hypothetical protein